MSASNYIVRAAPPAHYAWLVEKTGCVLTSDFRAIEAVDSAGAIRGMVGYCNWAKNSVVVHIALGAGAGRALLKPGFSYPFEEADRRVLIGFVSAGNQMALRLDKHLGFREVARIREGHSDGKDLVILELRREDCRFLSTHQKEKRAA